MRRGITKFLCLQELVKKKQLKYFLLQFIHFWNIRLIIYATDQVALKSNFCLRQPASRMNLHNLHALIANFPSRVFYSLPLIESKCLVCLR